MFKTTDIKSRLAIVDKDKCKPTQCQQECRKICPVVRLGKECVTISKTTAENKRGCASILESSCIGCGMCVTKCPFGAIQIINLPNELSARVTFRYGSNSFQLHRLPQPRRNHVLGIIGVNGIGKSTIVKILAGKLKPNWGHFQEPATETEIIQQFRGSELQNYFAGLFDGSIRCIVKPQMVEALASTAAGNSTRHKTVQEFLGDDVDLLQRFMLTHLRKRTIADLSGGELHRLDIAKVCATPDKTCYFFDEPTNFLDVKQRMRVSQEIRKLLEKDAYVMVVDHDIAILDYISDYVCCLYGKPGAYGIVSLPSTVREGINQYLEGFLPSENMRIRPETLKFVRPLTEAEELEFAIKQQAHFDHEFPSMQIQQGSDFQLTVEAGGWNDGDVVLMVGENGTGKTTLVRTLAGLVKPQSAAFDLPELHISYKPQKIQPNFQGTVQQLLYSKIGASVITSSLFQSDVLEPLRITELDTCLLSHLSGGELQRVAIALALGKPADVYLIDEPFSMLDVEMRLNAATAIRRYVKHRGKSAFVVEHDIAMGVYLSDKVICFSGEPGIRCTAHSPTLKEQGMNLFMRNLDVTIRQDPITMRPRINKADSQLDREQKQSGQYYLHLQSRDTEPNKK